MVTGKQKRINDEEETNARGCILIFLYSRVLTSRVFRLLKQLSLAMRLLQSSACNKLELSLSLPLRSSPLSLSLSFASLESVDFAYHGFLSFADSSAGRSVQWPRSSRLDRVSGQVPFSGQEAHLFNYSAFCNSLFFTLSITDFSSSQYAYQPRLE